MDRQHRSRASEKYYVKYDSTVSSRRFDAIVIGSGIGGLSTAAILSDHGKRVLVLERHWTAGGMTHTFKRGPFEWDVGLHYLPKLHDESNPVRRVFDYLSEGRLTWASIGNVTDRIVFDDAVFDLPSGEGQLREMLAREFPHEVSGIDRYLSAIRSVAARAERFFVARALPRWLASMLAPVLTSPFLREARKTTSDVLSEMISDPRLRGLLTARWGNYALPPGKSSFGMHALMAAYYLDGASYPSGGASRILHTIAPRILRADGDVRTSAEVEEILVHKGRVCGVRLSNGDEIRSDVVVSTVGVRETMTRLLREEHRPRDIVAGLSAVGPSCGHVALYLGVHGAPKELGLERASVWACADYDHDAAMERYVADASAPLPFVFIDSAAMKDPTWRTRHGDLSTVTAIAPAPFARFRPWSEGPWRRRGAEYEEIKSELASRMRDVVMERFPALRDRIAHEEVSTPLSTAQFTGRAEGAIYGLEHSPSRFDMKWLRATTPIRGLFLGGQDLVSVGVGASLMSGVIAASSILRRDVLRGMLRAKNQAQFSLSESDVT